QRGNGRRGDEGDQLLVEALALVLGVVLLGEAAVDGLELQQHEAQALALDARHDLPDQATLHAVGLDQHQGALAHCGSSLVDTYRCASVTSRPQASRSAQSAWRRSTSCRIQSIPAHTRQNTRPRTPSDGETIQPSAISTCRPRASGSPHGRENRAIATIIPTVSTTTQAIFTGVRPPSTL